MGKVVRSRCHGSFQTLSFDDIQANEVRLYEYLKTSARFPTYVNVKGITTNPERMIPLTSYNVDYVSLAEKMAQLYSSA